MTRKRPQDWSADRFTDLSDDRIVELCATAVADRTIIALGDLSIENRIKKGAPPGSIETLLKEAERRQIPLARIAQHFVAEAQSGQSFVSTLMAPSSWKRYEIHAAQALVHLLKHDGARVESWDFDARITGEITGQERQVDLLLRSDNPRNVVACEFKEYPERLIPVEKIEAFATKLKDVRADRGLFATPCGYNRGAIATAKHHGIVLFRFRELSGKEVGDRYPQKAAEVRLDEVYWLLERDDAGWVFQGSITQKPRP